MGGIVVVAEEEAYGKLPAASRSTSAQMIEGHAGAPALAVASVRLLSVVLLPDDGLPTRPIRGSRGILEYYDFESRLDFFFSLYSYLIAAGQHCTVRLDSTTTTALTCLIAMALALACTRARIAKKYNVVRIGQRCADNASLSARAWLGISLGSACSGHIWEFEGTYGEQMQMFKIVPQTSTTTAQNGTKRAVYVQDY